MRGWHLHVDQETTLSRAAVHLSRGRVDEPFPLELLAGIRCKPAPAAPRAPAMTARDDERSLARVVADSDWKLACAIAGTTDTDPQLWFELLQDGKPFLEIQQLAQRLRKKRIDAF